MFWCHWTLLVPRVVVCVPQPILLARGPSPSTSPRLRARAGRRAVSLEPMDVDPPAGPSTARSLCGSWPRCWLDEAEWPPISGTGVPTVRPPASPRPEAPWPAFAAASPAPGGDVPLAVAPGGGDPPAPAGEEGSRRTGPGGGPPAAPAAGPSAAAPARSSGPLLGGPPTGAGAPQEVTERLRQLRAVAASMRAEGFDTTEVQRYMDRLQPMRDSDHTLVARLQSARDRANAATRRLASEQCKLEVALLELEHQEARVRAAESDFMQACELERRENAKALAPQAGGLASGLAAEARRWEEAGAASEDAMSEVVSVVAASARPTPSSQPSRARRSPAASERSRSRSSWAASEGRRSRSGRPASVSAPPTEPAPPVPGADSSSPDGDPATGAPAEPPAEEPTRG